MPITTLLKKEDPKAAINTDGRTTTNPLQLKQPNNNPLQLQAEETAAPQQETNNTGLPDNLKSGVEALSGFSLDDVKVHYNSDKPTQLQALAYAQGTDIHIAPGQEQHLPHEAWHVVQQKQGRVQPTMQMKQGIAVNDDKELEKEADIMGGNALQMKENLNPESINLKLNTFSSNAVQRMYEPSWVDDLKSELEGKNYAVSDLAIGKHDFFIWDKNIGDLTSDHIHVFFNKVPQSEDQGYLVKASNMNYTVTCKGKTTRATHLRVDEPGLDSSLIKSKMDKNEYSEAPLSPDELKSWGVGNTTAIYAKDRPRTFNEKPMYQIFAKWVDDLRNAL